MEIQSTPRKQLVVGFAFSEDLLKVVLEEKDHPEEQAGKINGPGGAREAIDISIAHAMSREFQEECGVITDPDEWIHCAHVKKEHVDLDFFCARGDKFMQARTMTSELIMIVPADLKSVIQPFMDDVEEIVALSLDILNKNTFTPSLEIK